MNPKRLLSSLLIVSVATSLILAACGSATAAMPEPISVLQGYYDALEARDIDKVMSFWADDAVYSDEFGERLSGQEEIRAGLQSAINDHVTVEVIDPKDINGRVVYEYKVFVGGQLFLSGPGLTIVQDGKIIFDGTEETWAAECSQNASQRFCSEAPVAPALNPTATPEPVDPATIVQNFHKAIENRDIEAAMALVAEDIKCRGAVYLTGKQSYRSLVQADINDGGRGEISNLKVEGDKVTYNWEAYSEAGFFQARGTETLQIKDGLIVYCEVVVQ